MADFCRQCSIEIFGEDFKELAGIVSPEEFTADKAAFVMCEGCGPIFVNPDGSCIDSTCVKHQKES
ncbi:MAG: hypothetical protein PHY47_00650 [Lachnospiraceae bacterium]|nr:hypothetical protein [Lachnospiraceae bacterium]